MTKEDWNKILVGILVIYSLVLSIGSVGFIIANLPTEIAATKTFEFKRTFGPFESMNLGPILPAASGYAVLAFFAGIAGSFLSTAQSLATYVGNETFKASWAIWYLLRPWIGALLGIAIFFVLNAGLLTGTPSVSPFGVVALGFLGGWFSKNATDKLKDIFDAVFKSDEDLLRKNKLKIDPPHILAISPNPVPAGHATLKIDGTGFINGAGVNIGTDALTTTFISDKQLDVSLNGAFVRPAAGIKVKLLVRNPQGSNPLSNEVEVTF